MSPLAALGTFAFGGVSIGDFESIQTVTVGSGGATEINFSSIPSTFKTLQIRAVHKSSNSGDYDWSLRFNGDSGSNYSKHQIFGEGSSVYATGTASQTQIPGGFQNYTAWGATILEIVDYANTGKAKSVRVFTGSDSNTNGVIGERAGGWFNTAAISSIKIIPTSGSSGFAEFSSFALYGIKG